MNDDELAAIPYLPFDQEQRLPPPVWLPMWPSRLHGEKRDAGDRRRGGAVSGIWVTYIWDNGVVVNSVHADEVAALRRALRIYGHVVRVRYGEEIMDAINRGKQVQEATGDDLSDFEADQAPTNPCGCRIAVAHDTGRRASYDPHCLVCVTHGHTLGCDFVPLPEGPTMPTKGNE